MEFDVLALITEQLLPLTVALIVIGFIVKQIPGIPNWTIPAALTLVGAVGAMAILGWTVSAALRGIIAAGLAVFGNQFWKQFMDKSGNDQQTPPAAVEAAAEAVAIEATESEDANDAVSQISDSVAKQTSQDE